MNGNAGIAGCCPFATAGGVWELPPLDGVDDKTEAAPGDCEMDNGVDIESRDLNLFILSSALLRGPPLLLCDSSLILLVGE